MSNLYELTGNYLYLMDLMDDPDTDPQMVLDTMESLNDEIERKADGYAIIKLEFESQIEKLDKEIKRLQKRKKTMENNKKWLIESLKNSMLAMDKKKIKTDLFSFTVKNGGQSLIIDDPNSIPEEYLIPQPPKVDEASIKKWLKTEKDAQCCFAHIEQGTSLLIK